MTHQKIMEAQIEKNCSDKWMYSLHVMLFLSPELESWDFLVQSLICCKTKVNLKGIIAGKYISALVLEITESIYRLWPQSATLILV